MAILTISIPTYNRNSILKKNIELLLPQLNNRVKVLILDNCSSTPVIETLYDDIKNISMVEIRRHPYNLGMSGNFIKCFEYCETEWMWFLGDDDLPLPNAVSTILNKIDTFKDLDFINFKSSLVDKSINQNIYELNTITAGINEFVENIDMYSFSNVVFMSTGVYRLPQILPNLRFAYLFGYCLYPHTILLLSSLKEKGSVLFAKEELVERFIADSESENHNWSRLFSYASTPVVMELPLDLSNQNRQKLHTIFRESVGNPFKVLSFVLPYVSNKPLSEIRFLYKTIVYRLFPLNITLIWQLMFIISKFVLHFPILTAWAAEVNVFVRKKIINL